MNKPNGYDAAQAGGEWTPVELGGHYLIIKNVAEIKSSKGADMIVVSFDFAQSDKQPGYFMDAYKADARAEKKWPNQGTKYIMILDSRTGQTSRDFKSFITSVEKSNRGFVTQWGDAFSGQFRNRLVGAVFGEVENEYNGIVRMRHELRWWCATGDVAAAKIPTPKYINTATPSGSAANTNFMDIPDTDEEAVPF